MTELRLESLSLKNFRCFEQCEVTFHPHLTVLVAENGTGKTAVLDAAGAALSVFVNALYPAEKIRRIDRGDVRLVPDEAQKMLPCLPTEYTAHATVQDAKVTWSSTVQTYGQKVRPSTKHLKPIQAAAQPFLTDSANLPLVAFYGTGRLWSEQRQTEYRRSSVGNIEERISGYVDCLTPSSSFKGVSSWYEHRFRQIASPAYRESLPTNLAMIEGVKVATDTVLQPTGWSDLRWDDELYALTARHDTRGELPLSLLSDGVRTMLALVADVARRCASLNPQLKERATIETPGVLIIDEVDMHLHPRWQQQVLGLVQRAFPALQIIVSTHSPHVLSTVDKSSIRVLNIHNGDVAIETPLLQTRGVESANVLAAVMDVDPVPQLEESIALSVYRKLIETGKAESPEAIALRKRLMAHYGERHPVMLECDRLSRFQRFRLAQNRSENT
jgi:predicted ATP-binding protein involved in virulence